MGAAVVQGLMLADVLHPANFFWGGAGILRVELGKDEVHVWRVGLGLGASALEQLQATLTRDELDRAARFHFDADRKRFIAARGFLRKIVSRYLGIAPDEIRFRYGLNGKPELDHPVQPRLEFNLSHSQEVALYAISAGQRVGIDVEQVRPNLEFESIARRFFAPGEYAAIAALADRPQQVAFYNCWTRKEAFVKARGEGLTYPLNQFEVSLLPDEPAALLHTPRAPHEAAHWSIHALTMDEAYAAAVAVEGQDRRIICREWHTELMSIPIPPEDMHAIRVSA